MIKKKNEKSVESKEYLKKLVLSNVKNTILNTKLFNHSLDFIKNTIEKQ